MPPRYVYWTIIVDGQPTAFRSGSLEDIMPTFNRVKEKQPSAELKWFQYGKLWPSRHDAQDFMRARGERGRERDPRQSGDAASPPPERAWNAKPKWKPKSPEGRPFTGRRDERPEWKPKGTFKPKEPGHASGWGEKPAFAPRSSGASARQAPKGSARDQARASFRPKSYSPKPDDGMTRSSRVQSRHDKLEWTPKGSASGDASKRKWVPKAEYKKSLGIEARRDDKWRPGGEHKDPKQKYKDAKKAKWTKFKQNIRARSTRPRKPRDE